MSAAPTAQPVVLVDGTDPTLVAEAVGNLIDDLVGDSDRTLAVEDFGGGEVDLAAVADGCATPPFLVERRIVVVRDVGRFTTDELAPLLGYLDDPLDTTTLVLVAGQGATAAKVTAVVKAKGHVLGAKVDSKQAGDWMKSRLRDAPVTLDAQAAALMKDHFGEDVSRLVPLLEVLAAAFGEGAKLNGTDIEPYLGDAGSVTPWTFTDAIDAGRTEDALSAMRRMLRAGDRHPLEVFAMIRSHVVARMRVDGPAIRTEAEAAAALGIASGRSTYPAKKALQATRRWGSEGVAQAVALVADAEVDLKGASAWPGDAVLEVLVARLCRLAGPTAAAPTRG